MADQLTEKDHNNLDVFLGHVLDAHAAGTLSRPSAIGTLAQVVAALDKRNYGEVRAWLQRSRDFIETN